MVSNRSHRPRCQSVACLSRRRSQRQGRSAHVGRPGNISAIFGRCNFVYRTDIALGDTVVGACSHHRYCVVTVGQHPASYHRLGVLPVSRHPSLSLPACPPARAIIICRAACRLGVVGIGQPARCGSAPLARCTERLCPAATCLARLLESWTSFLVVGRCGIFFRPGCSAHAN